MGYITVIEAARRLGVSPQTIHNWIKWGLVRRYDLYRNPDASRPGKVLVNEEDLEKKVF